MSTLGRIVLGTVVLGGLYLATRVRSKRNRASQKKVSDRSRESHLNEPVNTDNLFDILELISQIKDKCK